jgi:uncharacterized protein DUF2442/uncharacterized protein DUF1801
MIKNSGKRGMTTLVIDESSLRAFRVHVTEEALVVDLVDGRSVSVPLVWYPRLLQASVEEREQFQLIGSGEGIHVDGDTRASRRLEPIEKRLTVEEYIASQSESAQPVLKHVRSAIRKAVPSAEEVISYKIPTYKLHGTRLLFFAGWKRHYSLLGKPVLMGFRDDCSGVRRLFSMIHST